MARTKYPARQLDIHVVPLTHVPGAGGCRSEEWSEIPSKLVPSSDLEDFYLSSTHAEFLQSLGEKDGAQVLPNIEGRVTLIGLRDAGRRRVPRSGRSRTRTTLCEFRLWPGRMDETPEFEEALANDAQARASCEEAVAAVMPPVTTWEQERWDIRQIPRCEPLAEVDEYRL
ncbi:hypothetical protein F5Y17DRAFT_476007 [Xylariaceae sp. FL0594]|nr:hypothetical protein F5Y17DRAFT_476007 [Xylariaceae sp. FL0594]